MVQRIILKQGGEVHIIAEVEKMTPNEKAFGWGGLIIGLIIGIFIGLIWALVTKGC